MLQRHRSERKRCPESRRSRQPQSGTRDHHIKIKTIIAGGLAAAAAVNAALPIPASASAATHDHVVCPSPGYPQAWSPYGTASGDNIVARYRCGLVGSVAYGVATYVLQHVPACANQNYPPSWCQTNARVFVHQHGGLSVYWDVTTHFDSATSVATYGEERVTLRLNAQ
jgi:hypothetical protein